MNKHQTRALNDDLRDLVKRFSSVQSDDLIANMLMTHALLIHLRSANMHDAIGRMRFFVDGMDLSLGTKETAA